jgi:predicted  nucleic acid-binding Zn-ribbon protein
VKASPHEQLRLLEVADLDADLGRLEHRRRGLPEHEEISRLETRDRALRDTIAELTARLSDLSREQAKAEADVEQVRSRIDRDRQRLDSGLVSSPKELEGLQSEVASLLRRQSDLEEIVLEVMERRENAEASLAAASTERSGLADRLSDAMQRRDVVLAEIDELAAKAGTRRAEVTQGLPAELLDLYDKLRRQHGVGAAALRQRRCEGCHLTLNTVDVNAIKAAPEDEVLRCEECRRILVRTPESGL